MSAKLKPVGDSVGLSIPRLEAREKITGHSVYTDDMVLPGMLYAAILGSDYAHARIISCDTSAAEALPGVKAVITTESIAQNLYGMCVNDEPILARGKVRYIGEPVAAVAAVDLETAKQAVQLIEVDYEELPAVFDAEEALEEGAPAIHEQRSEYVGPVEAVDNPNLASYGSFEEGDREGAWETCDVIVEGVYETPAQEHMYMEPCSTIVSPDVISGKITIWSSTQGIFVIQTSVARLLGLPMSKVRVIAPRIGGGFGGKGGVTNQPVTAALAIAAKAPVKLTYSREDDMMMNKSRHPSRVYMRTGAKKDGTLVAREARAYINTGAYADEGPFVAATLLSFIGGPYHLPHLKAEAWCVYTNRVKAGAFRGFGAPQAHYPAESQIDEIAERLGLDPIDVRMKNALHSNDKFLGGQNIDHGTLTSCLQAARVASDWDNRRTNPSKVPGKRRGVGMAAAIHISALLSAGATTKLNEDGTITVNTGAIDIGQGGDTVMCQLAAGVLGVPLEQINYAQPDSDFSPYNYLTAASRTTYTVGNAVTRSSELVKQQIFKHGSEMLECAEEDLEIRPGGLVGIAGVPDAQLPFAAVAGRALYASGGPIMGTYNWLYQPEPFDPKRTLTVGFTPAAAGVFAFAALVVEIEVDEATGKVDIVEAWSAHDLGRAINPGSVQGQIHGGLVQGFGYALTEELVWDDGRLINPSMMDYKVPGVMDVPYEIHPIILEDPEETGPFGARAIGEIPINMVAPAICNAIKHATGARVTTVPATGERVLRAMLETAKD